MSCTGDEFIAPREDDPPIRERLWFGEGMRLAIPTHPNGLWQDVFPARVGFAHFVPAEEGVEVQNTQTAGKSQEDGNE